MKRTLLAAFLIITSISSFAQSTPPGYSMHENDLNSLTTYELQTFDNAELVARAEEDDKLGKMSMYGEFVNTSLDIAQEGRWTTDLNGNQICQFRFKTDGAKGVGIIFNNFYLPQGAQFYMYAADRSWFEGPFDFTENHPTGAYRSPDMIGDEAIFEYVQPGNVVGTPRLEVKKFVHFYRFMEDPREDRGGVGTSEACEIDVNCPEGTAWADQRQAVVRLSLVAGNGVGFCTGSLVNNTSYDCKNYILTAMHCTIDSDASDLSSSTVRFNFQRANCGSGSAPMSQQKVGLILRADSNDNGGASGSDFALVEMEDPIPNNYNPYYAGWETTTTAPVADVNGHRVWCIHHPAGDAKKFSTGGNVVSASWGASNHHWRVTWVATQTDHGVTEGGSSGSPIFNKDKKIVGTLTGGGSFCNAPTSPDYYGKMDRHWTGNPNPANEDLVDWLDAAGTGITSLAGSFRNTASTTPCQPSTLVEVNELAFEDVKIYPAIATSFLQIESVKYDEIKEVRIFDAAGKLADQFTLNNSALQYNVSGLESGMYFIVFIGNEGQHLTQKFTVAK